MNNLKEQYILAAVKCLELDGFLGEGVKPFDVWRQMSAMYHSEDLAPEDYDEFTDRGPEWFTEIMYMAEERLMG